ncbi:MAG: KpsF/GutQ family sugar-phosphate isomerase [Calditrichaeota bacterium]|nr:MAG: KpsF/GutQ family sugar-phosphate isomerase [Calditrichota bacterium]MBL1204380.1 KpsF/GutQ family sugar-phosphate isomerase [Calditrichota bacterium]NOG44209.1 KpsF/GutQ family sugar-phosphate isomerase [Calditrichota bacterium]
MPILEAAKQVIRIEREALHEMENRIGENFENAIKLILQSEGRVIVTGMGKSGAIAKKMVSTFASTGTTSYFLHPAEGLHGDLGMVHKNDVVIAISKSGETEELLHILPALKRLNVPIVAMTGNKQSTLSTNSDVSLDISVKEEACPHDLAPTASTTVTLVMGDAMAVALLEARGFSADDFALLHPGGSLGKKLLMRVSDIMEKGKKLPFCFAEDNMRKAVLEMAHKRGICPVVDKNMQLQGVLTTGDLNRLIETNDQFMNIPVIEVMNKKPKLIKEDALAIIAYNEMEMHRIIAMPVVNNENRLQGIIHLHDLMQAGISV